MHETIARVDNLTLSLQDAVSVHSIQLKVSPYL